MYLTLNTRRVSPRPLALNGASTFDRLFDDIFTPRVALSTPTTVAARFDVIEKDDRFEARVEIPGVAKEDIDVQIDGATVKVKAEAKAAAEADKDVVLHSSRTTRTWLRQFTLPVEVAEDRAEAAYENGILTLTLPKKEVVQPKRLAIK